MHPRHPPAVAEREVPQGSLGGGVAATPLLHTQNCGMSRDGCSYTVERDGGGVASAPLSIQGGAEIGGGGWYSRGPGGGEVVEFPWPGGEGVMVFPGSWEGSSACANTTAPAPWFSRPPSSPKCK